MTEQGGFHQVFRNGAAVDGDEGTVGTLGGSHDGSGDQLLADAAFPGDQDRNIGLRRALTQTHDLFHGRRAGNHVGKAQLVRRLARQTLHFARQVLHLQGIADRHRDAFRAGRLDEEIGGPGPHGRNHRLDAAGRRQHDDRQVDLLALQGFQGLHPVHAGHDQVQQHDVDPRGRHAIQGSLAAVGGFGLVALLLDHRLQKAALCRIVVHDQNCFHHLTHAFSVALFSPGLWPRCPFWTGR